LHEYGHFLENQYYTSDSPGGFHSGTSLIDPRLAWSEGWGNFIQGAILNTPYYIDTFGNVDGVTLDIFRVSLEDQTSSGIIDKPCTSCGPNNSHTPEGNFREFAITRALWDIVDSNNDSETVSDAFDQIWATITSNVKGFNENKFKFNSMGAFYERRDALMTASSQSPASWSTIVSLHDQVADRSNYGLWVTPKSDGLSCSGGVYSTTPTDRLSNNIKISALSAGSQADSYIAYSTNFFAYTNLLNNNDFYHYYHGGGPATLTLTYQTASGTTNADLDLYLYKYSIDGQSYVIGDPDYLINYTQGVTVPSGAFGSGQTESLAITDLPAGHYMIHINTYYDSPSDEFNNQTNYELKINTGSGDKYLCPSTFPN
ncbi:MAG: hypothetical protein KDD50_05790, partial [Bdellovibrionales bacterium]|nr:hypothetical protein [Bdellovibrionales bacterium]